MLRREAKRKIRKTGFYIIAFVASLIGIMLIFITYNALAPFLHAGLFTSAKMVVPVGDQATISQIKDQLNDKNIIMDSLVTSSTSGTFVGVVHEGPTVYFSENQAPDWQVESLSLIISRTTVDNKKPAVIDLRGVHPIVKF